MNVSGFNWDNGNWPKCGKHGLTKMEIEAVFSNQPFVKNDSYPKETRLNAVGRNNEGRFVFVVFTIREIDDGYYIRPLSARYMHRKEIERYEETKRP